MLIMFSTMISMLAMLRITLSMLCVMLGMVSGRRLIIMSVTESTRQLARALTVSQHVSYGFQFWLWVRGRESA